MSGLSPSQEHWASFLIGFGLAHGLSPQHAREFAAAAYSESGLNPNRDNSSSGAAGFFQLLSSGYRRRAQALGGLHNPRANAGAIIGSYKNYWRGHPGAAPGQAAAAVEASGEGAQFYSSPLALLGGVRGSLSAGGAGAGVSPPGPVSSPQRNVGALLAAFSPSGKIDTYGLIKALAPQPQLPTQGQSPQGASLTPASLPPTAGGAASMLKAIREARSFGLHVGENPVAGGVAKGVHAQHSYHYQVYPGTKIGRAIDVSGDPAAMRAYYAWVKANLKTAELLQEGTGGPTHSTGPHVHVAI